MQKVFKKRRLLRINSMKNHNFFIVKAKAFVLARDTFLLK